MQYVFTMNMPSHSGKSIHQIIGEHESPCLADLIEVLQDRDFIIVKEIYMDNTTKQPYYSGYIALSYRSIGKIKEASEPLNPLPSPPHR